MPEEPQEEYKVRVKVIDKKGYCAAGHEKGDEIIFSGFFPTKGNLCLYSYNNMADILKRKRFGLRGPFETSDVSYSRCPDWENTVTFEITLLEKVPRRRNLEDSASELRRWGGKGDGAIELREKTLHS